MRMINQVILLSGKLVNFMRVCLSSLSGEGMKEKKRR